MKVQLRILHIALYEYREQKSYITFYFSFPYYLPSCKIEAFFLTDSNKLCLTQGVIEKYYTHNIAVVLLFFIIDRKIGFIIWLLDERKYGS